MNTDKMEHLILNFLKTTPNASFVQLCDGVAGFAGNETIQITGVDNVILWLSVSPAALQALTQLQRDKKIQFDGTHPSTYLIDGRQPKLPIANEVRPHKKLHWLPAVINLAQ